MKLLLAATATLVALAVPTPASGALTSIAFRDVGASAGETRTVAATTGRFDLVGMRWRGTGSVAFRVRTLDGSWGPWLDAAPEEDDQPDVGAPEARSTRGWRLGNPTWVGPSDRVRYRVSGKVRDLRITTVRSLELRIPLRATASAGSPPIVPRSAWGASESLVREPPVYAPAIRFASVHHTAGPNTYSQAEAAAILRGIQLYHVRSNGWNDIGYNFLVDRFGTVYEGRAGGIERNVVGAHIRGFNTGAVGVALMGSFQGTPPPDPAQRALERLLAWRLDLAHVDPLSSLTVISSGSERYAAGTAVPLRAVSGHRDTGLTTCPGDLLYERLPAIAAAAQRIGLPKLYEPRVTGGLGGLVRFQARASGALPWRVAVTDALGLELVSGTGSGPLVDWTWDATGAPAAGVRWRIEIAGATPATGTLGRASGGVVAVPLALTGVAASPAVISPDGDGQADTTTIAYTLTQPATVDAALLDANGVLLGQIAAPTKLPAGAHTLSFDGAGSADGVYTIVLTAVGAGGTSVSAQAQVGISRTLGLAALDSALLTPNGDGSGDVLQVRFQLAAPASVRLVVQREGKWVATPYTGALAAGAQVLTWDGTRRGSRAPDGAYTALLQATDPIGTSQVALPFRLDAAPPAVRLLARPPRLWVSEPASARVRVNGSLRLLTATTAGPLPLSGIRVVRTLVAVVRDGAGNTTVLRKP